MDTGGAESIETRKFKEAILAEIFGAYKESGTVYQKTADPEIQRTMLDLKRCYDLAIHHLSPLGVHAEKLREELEMRFSGIPPAPGCSETRAGTQIARCAATGAAGGAWEILNSGPSSRGPRKA